MFQSKDFLRNCLLSERNPSGPYDERSISYDRKGNILSPSRSDIVTLFFSLGAIPVGLRPDPQRYFDFHHTPADRLPAVHPRELALGAAAMSGLLYLLTEYGVE
jgi:hypothetical protein